MAILQQATMSTNAPNYQGVLRTRKLSTPVVDTIISKIARTRFSHFATSINYDLGQPSQPNISEEDSMKAVPPTTFTDTQETNQAQIFQRCVQVSRIAEATDDANEGVMAPDGTLLSVSQYDKQLARNIQAYKQDMEYTFIRGTGQVKKGDYRTTGLWNVIKTNEIDANNGNLTLDMILDALQKHATNSPNPEEELTFLVNPILYRQFNDLLKKSGDINTETSRTTAGYNINTWITPMGNTHFIMIKNNKYVNDTMMLGIDFSVIRPLYVDLSSVAQKEQGAKLVDNILLIKDQGGWGGDITELYSVIGLDHGSEKCHVKIKNIGGASPAETTVHTPEIVETQTAQRVRDVVHNIKAN